MKIIVNFTFAISVFAILAFSQPIHAQGTFQNLNFESANLSGYSPGNHVPVSDALPGWSAYFTIGGVAQPQTEVD